ncbi:MAG: SH3 domain-containing protein [Methylacidiphilales bacterium]|nr:SH3 domain-containing protein [Candidatus Methylacidiphilales bacterium]
MPMLKFWRAFCLIILTSFLLYHDRAFGQGNVVFYVNVKRLNFRKQPNLNSPIIGVYQCGEEVSVTGVTSDGLWYQVKIGGKTGFMYSKFLSSIPTCDGSYHTLTSNNTKTENTQYPIIKSVVAKLTVYQLPDNRSKIVGFIMQDDKMSVTGYTHDLRWARILYKDQTAFVYIPHTNLMDLGIIPVVNNRK